MAYIDPTTKKIVPLTGTLEQQNLAANQAGYNYVPDAGATLPTASLGNTMNTSNVPVKTDTTAQTNAAVTGAIAGASTPAATWTSPTGAVIDAATGNVITPAQNQPSEQPQTKTTVLNERVRSMLGFTPSAPTSTVDQYNALAQQNDLTGKQKEVNDLQAQLNTLIAQSQADQLSTIGQGRGIPQAIIGGQQAQIARETAIKALPITAQLNAAQGRLKSAEDNINTLLGLVQKDNEAKYKYQSDQIDLAFKFADADQKAALEERKAQLDLAKTNADTFNKAAQSYVDAAIKAGDYATAGKLATATSYEQLGLLASGIKNSNRDLQFVSGTANQPAGYFDKNTGRFTALGEIGGGTGVAGTTSKTLPTAVAKSNIDLITGLQNDSYLSTAVGPNTLARTSFSNIVTGGKDNFIAGVEQLKSQLSLDSLINAKARGATFGALSDTEMRILSASATKLGTWAIKNGNGDVIGYQTSEGAFKKELDKINNFAKLDYILKGGTPADVGAQQMPNGKYVVQNSDGTFTELN